MHVRLSRRVERLAHACAAPNAATAAATSTKSSREAALKELRKAVALLEVAAAALADLVAFGRAHPEYVDTSSRAVFTACPVYKHGATPSGQPV